MNPSNGRFTQQDSFLGAQEDPISIHKYLYANAVPANLTDPSGKFSIGEISAASAARSMLSSAAIGGLIGAGDAYFGDRDVLEGFTNGAAVGALVGPLARVKALKALLVGAGVGLSTYGVYQAVLDDDYDLAVYRGTVAVVGSLITWRAYLSDGVTYVNPATLRWTQNTAGGRGRAALLRASMTEKGWAGPPIDVVRTSGGLVTVDHTRAAVALELGMSKIPVRVHSTAELLPTEMAGRFGGATTWGEAIAHRAGSQNPPLPPTGTNVPPRLPSQ